MIKINLANTLVSKSDDSKPMSPTSIRDSIIKVILILIPIVGICTYEKMDLDSKNEKLKNMVAEQNTITTQLAKSGSVSDIVTQKKELEKDSEEKKKVMRQIFGYRSLKIMALTLLQDNIPNSCWFKRISINDKKVNVQGFSSDIQAAQGYIATLAKQTTVFSNISGQDISEDKSVAAGTPAQYKFEFVLELKEQ
jgi:Tfp pilus assembly protein PilN